jgi:hypothetical protein
VAINAGQSLQTSPQTAIIFSIVYPPKFKWLESKCKAITFNSAVPTAKK